MSSPYMSVAHEILLKKGLICSELQEGRVRNKDFQVLLSQLAVFITLFPIVAYKKHTHNMNK